MLNPLPPNSLPPNRLKPNGLITICLLFLLLPATAHAQFTPYTPPPEPVCFDATPYRKVRIEPYNILQFLGARCVEITPLTATPGIYRYQGIHPYYPHHDRLPLDIYLQPADSDDIYHLSTGSSIHHVTVPLHYRGTYYVVVRDQITPSILIINSLTLKAEFRRFCALTESVIPPYNPH